MAQISFLAQLKAHLRLIRVRDWERPRLVVGLPASMQAGGGISRPAGRGIGMGGLGGPPGGGMLEGRRLGLGLGGHRRGCRNAGKGWASTGVWWGDAWWWWIWEGGAAARVWGTVVGGEDVRGKSHYISVSAKAMDKR